MGGQPQCPEPALCHHPISDLITPGLVAAIMRFAVDFDGETGGEAGEIERVGLGWHLLAELETAGPLLELHPKQHLGQAHGLAQRAGTLDRVRVRTNRSMHRPPQILPGTGRGTIRRMVEGPGAIVHRPALQAPPRLLRPLRGHLPVPGRKRVRMIRQTISPRLATKTDWIISDIVRVCAEAVDQLLECRGHRTNSEVFVVPADLHGRRL